MNFKDKLKLLESLGSKVSREYEYRTNKKTGKRNRVELNVINSVFIPLAAEEWCSIAMNDGDNYLGGCCGTMSAIQDIISGAFRFGSGHIKTKDLVELAGLALTHDPFTKHVGFEPVSLDDKAAEFKDNWKNYSPWDKIACLWQIVRECCVVETAGAPPCKNDEADGGLKGALFVLNRTIQYFDFAHFF